MARRPQGASNERERAHETSRSIERRTARASVGKSREVLRI